VRLTWPLTGRSEEMRFIETAVSDTDCAGLVVLGAAGVGKSRIAREALSSAAVDGREIRWASATSSARTLPLGAFVPWVSAGTDDLQLVRGVICLQRAIDALSALPVRGIVTTGPAVDPKVLQPSQNVSVVASAPQVCLSS
jgi:hypothetical protein